MMIEWPFLDTSPGKLFVFGRLFAEQCQIVVFVTDDFGVLGPVIPDLVTELCQPQDTA